MGGREVHACREGLLRGVRRGVSAEEEDLDIWNCKVGRGMGGDKEECAAVVVVRW